MEAPTSVDAPAVQDRSASAAGEVQTSESRQETLDVGPPPPVLERIVDPSGWSLDLHSAHVLTEDPRFKGAVWVPAHPETSVLFHNSGFSNWFESGFVVEFNGTTSQFRNSEQVIMAMKERAASKARVAFSECLQKHSTLSAKDSKASASSVGDPYPLWAHHSFQVVLGGAACLLKFSQSKHLAEVLLATQEAAFVECAPYDGAWGVAKSSSDFLRTGEKPEDYMLQSSEQSEFQFTAGSWRGNRRRCEANALGKALMLTRRILQREPATRVQDVRLAFDTISAELDSVEHLGVSLQDHVAVLQVLRGFASDDVDRELSTEIAWK